MVLFEGHRLADKKLLNETDDKFRFARDHIIKTEMFHTCDNREQLEKELEKQLKKYNDKEKELKLKHQQELKQQKKTHEKSNEELVNDYKLERTKFEAQIAKMNKELTEARTKIAKEGK